MGQGWVGTGGLQRVESIADGWAWVRRVEATGKRAAAGVVRRGWEGVVEQYRAGGGISGREKFLGNFRLEGRRRNFPPAKSGGFGSAASGFAGLARFSPAKLSRKVTPPPPHCSGDQFFFHTLPSCIGPPVLYPSTSWPCTTGEAGLSSPPPTLQEAQPMPSHCLPEGSFNGIGNRQ